MLRAYIGTFLWVMGHANANRVSIFATIRTYARAHYVPDVFTYNHFLGTIMSILEQNVGIVAANLLPIGLLFEHRWEVPLISDAENPADDADARELNWNNDSAYELQNRAWQSNPRLAGPSTKQPTMRPPESGVRSAASAEDIHDSMLEAVAAAMLSGAPNVWSSSETIASSTLEHSLSDLVIPELNVQDQQYLYSYLCGICNGHGAAMKTVWGT